MYWPLARPSASAFAPGAAASAGPRDFQFLIKNAHRFAGETLVLREIKIAAGGDAFQFLACQLASVIPFAERELEQNVHGGSGVMREFLRLLPILNQCRARQADAFIPADALLDP